jgi:hypothetical protein
MRIAEYSTMRRAVQSNAPAPGATAVAAMETDLRAGLLATGLFHSVEVGTTDDPDRLVIAMVGFAPDVDIERAAQALSRVWTKQVAYGFWHAQSMRIDKTQVELQGATRLSMHGHYATVHLIAQEAPAPAPRMTLPAAGRPTPSVGIGQLAVAGEPVRRTRRWLPSRPDVA